VELSRRKPVELLEAHDERPPLVRVDAVALAFHEEALLHVHALDAHQHRERPAAPPRIVLGQRKRRIELRLELHRAFEHARRADRLGGHRRQPCDAELVTLIAIAAMQLRLLNGIRIFL
jgi:hypothetical protein